MTRLKTIWMIAAAVALGVGGLQISPLAGQAWGGSDKTLSKREFQSISPLEAKSLIESRDDLLLIDVRSPEEYEQGALPGSTLIPFWDILKGAVEFPKDKTILLVCAVGGRSYAAGQYLSLRGYREVYNLEGGLSAWAQQRVPLPARGK